MPEVDGGIQPLECQEHSISAPENSYRQFAGFSSWDRILTLQILLNLSEKFFELFASQPWKLCRSSSLSERQRDCELLAKTSGLFLQRTDPWFVNKSPGIGWSYCSLFHVLTGYNSNSQKVSALIGWRRLDQRSSGIRSRGRAKGEDRKSVV